MSYHPTRGNRENSFPIAADCHCGQTSRACPMLAMLQARRDGRGRTGTLLVVPAPSGPTPSGSRLGYPFDASPGVRGGYAPRSRTTMPPRLLDDEGRRGCCRARAAAGAASPASKGFLRASQARQCCHLGEPSNDAVRPQRHVPAPGHRGLSIAERGCGASDPASGSLRLRRNDAQPGTGASAAALVVGQPWYLLGGN